MRALVAAALLAAGCTTTLRAPSPGTLQWDAMAARVQEDGATVILHDGRAIDLAPGTRFDPLTLAPPGAVTSAAREVDRVRFRRSGTGALQGLGIGLLAGAALGASIVAGAISADPCGTYLCFSPGYGAIAGAGFGALIGGATGLTIGALLGAPEDLVF